MDLTSDFARAQIAYAKRLAYASAHRQQELWSAGPLLHADPFDFERLGYAPGKPLKKRPTLLKNKRCYWLDEQDILLAIRRGIDHTDDCYEEFFFPEDGFLKSCLYSYSTIEGVINVKTRLFQDGRVSEVFLLGKHGSSHETYHYEGDILVRIRVEEWEGGEQGTPYNTVFEYDQEKLREIVYVYDNGYREVRYKAK